MVRKRAESRAITIDPVVKPYYVEVDKPDLHKPSGDFQRLDSALQREWGIALHDTDLYVLRRLQEVIREGEWKVTAAVRHTLGRYDEAVGLWPGLKERLVGLAIDIGTTTVSCQLVDMSSGEVLSVAGAMNPQIRFGEDLMSRVSRSISSRPSPSPIRIWNSRILPARSSYRPGPGKARIDRTNLRVCRAGNGENSERPDRQYRLLQLERESLSRRNMAGEVPTEDSKPPTTHTLMRFRGPGERNPRRVGILTCQMSGRFM